ncbi:hypothetical protein EJ03DRAFT_116331 [Teratosphaeria nubilosa]|uniref:Zn(2)-C6 fungal-type domain-containing protein n=1 Tax=Teratosphaeria nubilosa TaxID=161662 RepID=A0A6G1L7T8_9PEZI|nr:hypothetical protein EJ03DRAFT_116331 [Teratosphaeria nubilosa]
MPKEPSLLREVRKGTHSCIECRQRKIKCIWPDGEGAKCQHCSQRARDCVPQIAVPRDPNIVRVTSRDRIKHLEETVDSLWAAVRNLQANANLPVNPVQRASDPAFSPDDDSGDASDSEMADAMPREPPTHLQRLFDNGKPQEYPSPSTVQSPAHAMEHRMSYARAELQRLIPCREDLQAIAKHATGWLSIYHELFPSTLFLKNEQELLDQYARVQDARAPIIQIAAFLLAIVITVRQMPATVLRDSTKDIHDGQSYAAQVSSVVERCIVQDEHLTTTLEGIDIGLMRLRLHLTDPKFKYDKVFLGIRHTVALAEFIGLSRACSVTPSSLDADSGRKAQAAALWHNICVSDRLVGMLFNLPIATAAYALPLENLVLPNGRIAFQSYLCQLAEVAARVNEIDSLQEPALLSANTVEKVLRIDNDLRQLESLTPKAWWNNRSPETAADQILQYLHKYFTARAHLRLASSKDSRSIYAYSYMVCKEACREVASRYVHLRTALPSGFFACRVLDLEALTAAVFLLNASAEETATGQTASASDSAQLLKLVVQDMTSVMDSVSVQPNGDFAKKAAAAIRSLETFHMHPSSKQSLTVRIPLLGKVQITKKIPTSAQQMDVPQQAHTGYSNIPMPWQENGSNITAPFPVASNPFPSTSWLFTEPPFLMDGLEAMDQWYPSGDLDFTIS